MIQADKKLRKYTEKVKADVLKNEDTKAFIYVSINNNVIDINQAGTHKKMADLFFNMLLQNPDLLTPILQAANGVLAERGELPKIK